MKAMAKMSMGWFAAVWLAACSDKLQSSTEVENEISARVLQGVAMDSVALDSVPWTAWDGSGAVLASGMTDSVGGFRAELRKIPVAGILVEVRGAKDTLRSMSPLDGSAVRAGVATVLVHPLSSASLPPLPPDRASGFTKADVALAERRGQELLVEVLGIALPWRELRSDSGFRAFDRKRSVVPAPSAGLVRAVASRASRDGAGAAKWLDARRSASGPVVASDSSFERDLVASMASLGIDFRDATEYVVRLDAAADRGGRWEKDWKMRAVFPDSLTLAKRVPWAADPKFAGVWMRLVESTGDRVASYESSLPSRDRALVRPGRTHELVVEAIGPLVEPDPAVSAAVAEAVLDTFLARTVPQALLLIGQIRPEVWGGFQGSGPESLPGPADADGAIGRLLTRTLQRGFATDWKYRVYQNQADFDSWLDARVHLLSSDREALDTLRAEWSAHPDPELPQDLFR